MWDVKEGNCDMCRQPYWCVDEDVNTTNVAGGYYGQVTTVDAWLDAFWDRDGGRAYGARQCRYKRSQRDLFVQTIRAKKMRY